MPSCQAINCTNTRGKCDKSFFEIPDPSKSAEKRRLCKLWIDHLRNDKLHIETFVWSKSRIVCQDHFEDSCFETSPSLAKSLGFKVKPILKEGSIPTIVKAGPGIRPRHVTDRRSTETILEKRRKAQVILSPMITRTIDYCSYAVEINASSHEYSSGQVNFCQAGL